MLTWAHSFFAFGPGQPRPSVTPSGLCAPKQKTGSHTAVLPGPPSGCRARPAAQVSRVHSDLPAYLSLLCFSKG